MVYKIRKLIDTLNHNTYLYNAGIPEISDKQWDDMYYQLKLLEDETGIIFNDSPTQSIAYKTMNSLPKVKHSHKMLSLAKTKDVEEVKKFMGDNICLAMLKMDGLTCSLTYEHGQLVRAETRGNGEEGEDITHNAKVIPSIPLTLPREYHNIERLVIDGEIICDTKTFEKEFSNEYANSRNFAAGSIRLLESQECAKRSLTFVAWDVIEGLNEEIICVSSLLDIIDDFGFNTVPRNLADNTTDIEVIIDILKNKANIYNYPIDGIVFKFDNIIYGKSLGATTHHFNNAIAYKFYDDTYPTTLLDIEWSPGRTGVLTPVTIFEPVEIDGTTVQRASLHNISVLKHTLYHDMINNNPYPYIIKSQEVNVYKSNMINPQIKSANIDNVDKDYEYLAVPETCPICGKPTEIKVNDDVEILYCTNPNCEAKLINQLDHFAGKKGLDIKGLSKATLEKLINWGWVEKIDDLFELKIHRAEWIKKPGFGAKSVDNVLNAIEASKSCELHQFIAALGIPLIGTTASKALQKEFGTWSNFMDAVNTNYKFYTLEDFGDEKHLAIHQFNYDIANCIAENYLNFKEASLEEESSNLEGLSFVITGKLKIAKNRDHLKTLIENAGGKVVGSVSKNTNYLINNDAESTSAKNKKAAELGVEVITETEFFEKFLKK